MSYDSITWSYNPKYVQYAAGRTVISQCKRSPLKGFVASRFCDHNHEDNQYIQGHLKTQEYQLGLLY